MSENATLLEETTKHIEALQSRKSELLYEVQQIEKKLQDAKARRAKLVNLAAPVSKLPDELIADIFLRCHGTRVVMSPRAMGKPFEVSASHVSSHWRRVVLSTPLLWNAISLDIGLKTRTRALQRLSANLTRSGQCYLDISLHITTSHNIPEILSYLTPHAARWHRVSIAITSGSVEDIYAPFYDVVTPALIHLSLRIGNPEDDADSPRTEYSATCPSVLAQCSPLLKFVRIAGKVVGNLAPPLSAVQTLHVDAWPKNIMALSQFRAMFDSLPCLSNLSLTGLSIQLPRNPLDASEPILLPILRSLRIRGNSTPCHRLLALLSLPSLESLSLHGIHSFDSSVIPTLHALTLDQCILSEHELQNMFRAFPCVSTLGIDDSTPGIYAMLRAEAGEKGPWPKLKSIALKHLPPADVAPFCLLVLGRASSTVPLSSVHLDRRSRTVLRAKDFLEVLRELLPVENCDYLAPWPAYLGYDDPDDVWLY
ncbi:hypothetical protein DXG03_002801 [Asterophora parasitica]|uniref:F-box domain-containing protein n=1 Tax=Asterophora parasitica TaxID=117018 RepID=A0A9P7G839_9AGAR|nr:hypothetical protein DXG03_002801 [Asterophora parasitica]